MAKKRILKPVSEMSREERIAEARGAIARLESTLQQPIAWPAARSNLCHGDFISAVEQGGTVTMERTDLKVGDKLEMSGFGRTLTVTVESIEADSFTTEIGPVPFSSLPMLKKAKEQD